MTTFALKMIAFASMLIDHTAACLFDVARVIAITETTKPVYLALRGIGRLAFPIFCFLIVQGVMYTHSKPRYAARLGIFALISEVPFNVALQGKFFEWPKGADLASLFSFNSQMIQNWQDLLGKTHQNVDFTLLFGLVTVIGLFYAGKKEPGKRAVWFGLAGLTAAAFSVVALALHTDYGMGGVLLVAIMGILVLPLDDYVPGLKENRWFRGFVVTMAIFACCLINSNSFELIALAAVPLIMLYNGKPGPKTRLTKWGGYLFYPVHLTVLGAILVLPKIIH